MSKPNKKTIIIHKSTPGESYWEPEDSKSSPLFPDACLTPLDPLCDIPHNSF